MLLRIAPCWLLLACNFLVSGTDSPSVKVAVAPEYPPLAVAGRVSGVVTVRVLVDESGAVTRADVVQGHEMLKKAALNAARKWRFAPGTAATISLKFDFTVLPENATQESEVSFLPPDEVEVRKKPAQNAYRLH